MSVTEYTPVSFANGDPLVIEKLQALANNVQLLNERTPQILYKAHGVVKDRGLRVYATTAIIPPNSKTFNGQVDIHFGNFFSTSCKPMITLGVVTYPQRRFHTSVKGIGGNLVIPDHRGCTVSIQADEINTANNKIGNTVYVNVVAVGW